MGDTPGLVPKLNGKKVLNSQSREMVSKMMDFIKAEADAGNFVIDCKKVCGLSPMHVSCKGLLHTVYFFVTVFNHQ